jgi:hypothetical protein
MLDVRSPLLASLFRRLLQTPGTVVDAAGDAALRHDDEIITVSLRGEVTLTVREWRNLRAAVPGMAIDHAITLTDDPVPAPA